MEKNKTIKRLSSVLFAVLLGKPLAAYNRWYEKHVEEAKVIA